MSGRPYHRARVGAYPPAPYAELRVGDDDRERVVEHVKSAYAEGRLDKAEFDERLDRAMGARTHAELTPIMQELYGGHGVAPRTVAPYPGYAARHPARATAPGGAAPYPTAHTQGDRLGAGAAHLLAVLGFPLLGPLVLLLTAGKTSPYVRAHAVEALNFHLTALGAMILLSITLVGMILLPVIWIGGTVLSVIGGVRAIQEEPFRYPLTLRMVK